MRSSTPDVRCHHVTRIGWRERLRRRRRLDRQDGLGARLAELHRIRDLLGAARGVVVTGWVQDAWFVSPDRRVVDLAQAHRIADLPVGGACLVGAILHANGPVSAAGEQLVQRTLDLTWHALRGGDDEPVRWCPGPQVRARHLLDLVRWNDRPGRTRSEIDGLLGAAVRRAEIEIARSRELLAAAR